MGEWVKDRVSGETYYMVELSSEERLIFSKQAMIAAKKRGNQLTVLTRYKKTFPPSGFD